LLITTQPATSIITIAYHRSIIMTAFIRKSKAALLDHMKTLPDAHIAEEADFVAWGRQFVDVVVSHV
jgi:hypothetical protein